MKKKYFTEEERIAARREAYKRYHKKHKEKEKEYRQKHKEEKTEYMKQYYQENKENKSDYMKRYYKEHKEKRAEYHKQYRQEHKEELTEKKKQYLQTPMGRAYQLLNGYRKADRKYNRGECTLTAEWIIENIFSKKCAHCEETDWRKLGCNRLNNALPHTPDNVEPCCAVCNVKLPRKQMPEN